jgi:hypothetical protein
MKRILAFFVILFTAATINAQTAQSTTTPSQERAHMTAIRLQKTLALTEEQTAQVENIQLSKYAAIDAINLDAAKTQEQKDAAIAQVKTDKETEMQAVFTPDQLAKYLQVKEDAKRRKESVGQSQE